MTTTTDPTVRCVVCLADLPPSDATRVWPVGQPARAFHVCRPALGGPCFRRGVKTADVHAIAPGDSPR